MAYFSSGGNPRRREAAGLTDQKNPAEATQSARQPITGYYAPHECADGHRDRGPRAPQGARLSQKSKLHGPVSAGPCSFETLSRVSTPRYFFIALVFGKAVSALPELLSAG
jgi:hypothetical protein